MANQPKLTLLIELADKITGKLGKLEGKITKWQSKMKGKLNNAIIIIGLIRFLLLLLIFYIPF